MIDLNNDSVTLTVENTALLYSHLLFVQTMVHLKAQF